MWEYSDKVRDHYLNPRNVGEISNPDGYGETGNIKCGDALRLTFNLDDDKKIADIQFKSFGCGSAIASSSILTEMCKGLTIEEAEKITNDSIADELEGLPDAKMHCSVMGQDALKLAIDFYKAGGKTVTKEVTSRTVCACFNITEEDIENAIRQNGLTTTDQVTNYTKAGGGCGSCLSDIADVVTRVNAEIDEENHDHDHGHGHDHDADEPKRTLTMLEKVDLIRKVLNEDIRPALQGDHGDCELIDVDGNKVIIKFLGACSSCSMAGSTQNDFIGKTLQQKVHPDLVVELV